MGFIHIVKDTETQELAVSLSRFHYPHIRTSEIVVQVESANFSALLQAYGVLKDCRILVIGGALADAYVKSELSGKTIDNLVKRVDEVVEQRDALQSIVNRQQHEISAYKLTLARIRESLTGWFAAIARDILLGGTHRERNELYRGIAKSIDNWLSSVLERDVDDIPF